MPKYLFVIANAMLLAACGGSDDSAPTKGPLAAPVTASISVEWTERTAFGGLVEDLARRDGELFAGVEDGDVRRFDEATGSWETTEAKGWQLVETADGYIFTDLGFRLAPGSDDWEELDFKGTLWLGEDGRSLFRRGEERSHVIVSRDNGQTWQSLPEVPGRYFALQEFKGSLYAAVYQPQAGLWRLEQGAVDWEGALLDESVSELAITPHGLLLALGSAHAYWSADGNAWYSILTPEGFDDLSVTVAGHDYAGNPLLADWNSIYRVDSGGELERVVTHEESFDIRSAVMPDPSGILIGSFNGLWEITSGSDWVSERQVGVPGDYIQRVFHLADGTYAAKGAGPGMAMWARFDPASNAWIRQAFTENTVQDVAVLADGSQLLATTLSYEPQYGALFRWSGHGMDPERLYSGAEVVSVAVDGNGRWFIALGTDAFPEKPDYRVMMSLDEGETWSDSGLESSGARELASYCGSVAAVGPDGMHYISADSSNWTRSSYFPSGLSGVATRDNQVIIHSESRLWRRSGCNDDFEAVPLPENMDLNQVALARDGDIWATTSEGGILLAPEEDEWKRFSDALPKGELDHVSVDDNGTVWTRVVGKGVWSGDRY